MFKNRAFLSVGQNRFEMSSTWTCATSFSQSWPCLGVTGASDWADAGTEGCLSCRRCSVRRSRLRPLSWQGCPGASGARLRVLPAGSAAREGPCLWQRLRLQHRVGSRAPPRREGAAQGAWGLGAWTSTDRPQWAASVRRPLRALGVLGLFLFFCLSFPFHYSVNPYLPSLAFSFLNERTPNASWFY